MMTGRIVLGMLIATTGMAAQGHREQVEAFRAKHEADYRRDYVPLGGLFFLEPGVNTAGSAGTSAIVLPARAPASIGRFVYHGQQVAFEPTPGSGILLRGRPVSAPVRLKSDETSDRDELVIGNITLWVHESGERRGIRMRDPLSDAARSFSGFRWFPIEGRYRVVGTFIKDPAPRELLIPNLAGDDERNTTEGLVEFTLAGQKVRLRPMTTRPGRLYFTFRDGTSGRETYAAARFLYTDLRPDGTTVLDFNEAYNPPCAFNPYTTCPVPLPENRLAVKILAGERAYSGQNR